MEDSPVKIAGRVEVSLMGCKGGSMGIVLCNGGIITTSATTPRIRVVGVELPEVWVILQCLGLLNPKGRSI